MRPSRLEVLWSHDRRERRKVPVRLPRPIPYPYLLIVSRRVGVDLKDSSRVNPIALRRITQVLSLYPFFDNKGHPESLPSRRLSLSLSSQNLTSSQDWGTPLPEVVRKSAIYKMSPGTLTLNRVRSGTTPGTPDLGGFIGHPSPRRRPSLSSTLRRSEERRVSWYSQSPTRSPVLTVDPDSRGQGTTDPSFT